MRAAAFLAAAIVAVGIYLAIAASFTFSPMPIALGMLAIAATAAIGLVVLDGRTPSAPEY